MNYYKEKGEPMKRCPRCSSEISVIDKVCPRCGLAVSQMEEFKKSFAIFEDEENKGQNEENVKLSKKEEKKKKKEEKKELKKAKRAEKRNRVSDTDFSQYATNSGIEDPDEIYETDSYSERRRKKKKKEAKPVFEIDENGEFNIDTRDVEIVGEATGKKIEKLYEQQYEQSYSIKKSRGDYIPPKIKWWEIYKFTDRHFARRKIKKEINKAAKIRPSFVKKYKLLLLSIFFGIFGFHNFYAKNKKKGWVSVISLTIAIVGVSIPFIKNNFSYSVLGTAAFIVMYIWISDTINIIINQFKYRVQIDKFIGSLNVETRAKLGEKYIDMDLYHRPWWIRFRVWCQKKKRNYQEMQRDRRQRSIDRQKAKLAKLEEKTKIEQEISEYEQKEDGKLEQEKTNSKVTTEENKKEENKASFVDEKTISELKSFGDDVDDNGGDGDDEKSGDESVTENSDSNDASDKTENNTRKVGNLQKNKYAKFSNSKSKKKKKKK